MFLLIIIALTEVYPLESISIHPMFLLIRRKWSISRRKQNFNTSHVSINLSSISDKITAEISIHPMFLLIPRPDRTTPTSTGISIHPMFLLIFGIIPNRSFRSAISIHPMFLLIYPACPAFCTAAWISIHPMFLLIGFSRRNVWIWRYFNTSHVSINQRAAGHRTITDNISIHPMFLLIKYAIPPAQLIIAFQYIPCFY